jgi:hypothetical protein
MNPAYNRLVGSILIGTAVAGILFSLVGLFGIWLVNQSLGQAVQETIELTEATLQTTADTLVVTDESLTAAIANLNSLKNTLQATGRAINNSTPFVSTLSTMMGEELPSTIHATQISLESARTSAELIENVLTQITSIPFLPGEPYRPEIPLHVALAEVSESLEPLIDSFSGMEGNLNSTRGNLILLQAEFNIMSRQVSQIHINMTGARTMLVQYRSVVSDLQERLSVLKDGFPIWLNVLTWIFSFGFIWLAFAQIGLFVQGLQLIRTPVHTERILD